MNEKHEGVAAADCFCGIFCDVFGVSQLQDALFGFGKILRFNYANRNASDWHSSHVES